MISKIKSYLFPILLFLMTCVGMITFKDYGMSWDEIAHRDHGALVYQFLTTGNRAMYESPERYHGPLIPTLYYAVEKASPFTDARDVYFLYHALGFLLFIGGIAGFYALSVALFSNQTLAILGALCLFLSPRFFAESFYNNNDIPCMILIILSAWTAIRWLQSLKQNACTKTTIKWGILHALFCAWATDVRILALFAPVLSVMLMGGLVLSKRLSLKKGLLQSAIFIGAYLAFTVIFWPALWPNPVQEFITAFHEMQKFPWNGTVLFQGKFILASQLPWYYILVWMGITTPLLYLGLAAWGLCTWPRSITVEKLWILGWLVGPLGALIVLKSVLYDGWRHAYFVYPALLIMSLAGLAHILSLCKTTHIKKGCLVFVGIGLLFVGGRMAQDHPFEMVYFNPLAGSSETLQSRYEQDYWGLSFRKGLEYVLDSSSIFPVPVMVANDPGIYNSLMLLPEKRALIRFTNNPLEARFFITNFRWHPDNYPLDEAFFLVVHNSKILSVYRLSKR